MTRINAAIPVKLLSDHHLRAEQKEILRLPKLFNLKVKNHSLDYDDMPKSFTLGKGHLLFFMNRGHFIRERMLDLSFECRIRGIKYVDMTETKFERQFEKWRTFESGFWFKDWVSLDLKRANLEVVARIVDKMMDKAKYKSWNYHLNYKGQQETPQKTIERLLHSLI